MERITFYPKLIISYCNISNFCIILYCNMVRNCNIVTHDIGNNISLPFLLLFPISSFVLFVYVLSACLSILEIFI